MQTVFVIKAYDPPSIEGIYDTLEPAQAAAAQEPFVAMGRLGLAIVNPPTDL